MNPYRLLIASIFTLSASVLFASSDADRRIEDAARASYNFRAILDDKVEVRASDGVVRLTGTVPDKDARSLAEDTVTDLPGVVRVDNQIAIDPAVKENSDSWIAWKIRYQLLVRASVSNRDTKVTVKEGVVILTGTASSTAEKELVGVYAAEVAGVKSVRNEITVLADTAASKPAFKSMGEKIDDASITTQVKYALFTHKSTSALKTKITTTDGVVAITGTAANEAEKSLVTKLAQSIRGVKSVTNDLVVKG